jgi:hypothetical protein
VTKRRPLCWRRNCVFFKAQLARRIQAFLQQQDFSITFDTSELPQVSGVLSLVSPFADIPERRRSASFSYCGVPRFDGFDRVFKRRFQNVPTDGPEHETEQPSHELLAIAHHGAGKGAGIGTQGR